MLNLYRILLVLIALQQVWADETPKSDLYQEYLNTLPTMQGEFIQTNPDGSMQTGLFALKRPGKMRLEYQDTHELLLADGTWLIQYDPGTDEKNFIALEDSPAYYLLKDKVSFNEDLYVQDIKEKDGLIRLTLSQEREANDQTLTLVFEKNPLRLKQWIIKAANGQETIVTLLTSTSPRVLDDNLFIFYKDKPSLLTK